MLVEPINLTIDEFDNDLLLPWKSFSKVYQLISPLFSYEPIPSRNWQYYSQKRTWWRSINELVGFQNF